MLPKPNNYDHLRGGDTPHEEARACIGVHEPEEGRGAPKRKVAQGPPRRMGVGAHHAPIHGEYTLPKGRHSGKPEVYIPHVEALSQRGYTPRCGGGRLLAEEAG